MAALVHNFVFAGLLALKPFAVSRHFSENISCIYKACSNSRPSPFLVFLTSLGIPPICSAFVVTDINHYAFIGTKVIFSFFLGTNKPTNEQEIGRAGRDGRAANCFLLLCDRDFVTHHSLSHSKGLEFVQVLRRCLCRYLAVSLFVRIFYRKVQNLN